MKRFLVLILAVALALPLMACNGDFDETTPSESEITTKADESMLETEGNSQKETEGNSQEETESNTQKETEDTTEESVETDNKENSDMVYPENGAKIVLANDEVYGWWDTYNYKRTDSTPFYRHEDIYYPNSLTFEWEADDSADYYRLFLSTDKDFATDATESYFVNDTSLTLSHLFTGTKYYWQVIATKITDGGNGEKNWNAVYPTSFTTAQSPRCLEIEGVSNTRDIGGLDAVDGYRIKQGMIYRGGKLEDITDEGRAFFRDYIGITTDLDLRTPGEGGAGGVSPLGEDINYVNLDGRYYVGSKGISTDEGKALFAQEIRLFADPDNYPIYIHCSLGRDRTGTLAFVIEALLGVNFNDLMMDYELSVFSVTGTLDNASVQAIRNNIKATYDYINTFNGANFAERTEMYLLSIGITPAEIQSIKDILLEEVK